MTTHPDPYRPPRRWTVNLTVSPPEARAQLWNDDDLQQVITHRGPRISFELSSPPWNPAHGATLEIWAPGYQTQHCRFEPPDDPLPSTDTELDPVTLLPVAPPEPIIVVPRWTHEQLVMWKGDIAITEVEGEQSDWGTWAYAGWSDDMRAEFRTRYRAAGHSHVALNMQLNYPPYPVFNFAVDGPTGMPVFQERCLELIGDGLIPVLVLDTRDSEGQGKGPAVLDDVRRYLPGLKGVVPIVLPCWELDVRHGQGVFTSAEIRAMLMLADDLLDHPLKAIEFLTPPDHEVIWWDGRTGMGPTDYYRDMAGLIDIVLLETGYDRGPTQYDPAPWIDDIGGVVSRLTGQHTVPQSWPWGGSIPDASRHNMEGPDYGIHLPCVLFEYAAFLKWSSVKKRRWREWAQQMIPHLAGYGDA